MRDTEVGIKFVRWMAGPTSRVVSRLSHEALWVLNIPNKFGLRYSAGADEST